MMAENRNTNLLSKVANLGDLSFWLANATLVWQVAAPRVLGQKGAAMSLEEKYVKADGDRRKYVDAIVRSDVLGALTTLFNQQWQLSKSRPASAPEILPIKIEYVADILRRKVPAYRDAIFRIQDVQISNLRLLSRNMERFKLFRIAVLEDIIAKHELPKMGYIAGSPWPYLLPLVERDPSDKCVVIDGAHRIYYAMQRGKESIEVITIEGVSAPLPSKPIENLDDVKVTSDKWSRNDRYVDFDPAHFRSIRDVFESELWNSSRSRG
jgi:hypothetical protein